MKEIIKAEIQQSFLEASPNPEYLIKSIAEQGYSLETALADLIDNSITAKANIIEILSDEINESEILLYVTDNGVGMTYEELSENMKFPSSSMERLRDKNDLGRFGLGLKTASFSQTRKFTVISRKGHSAKYNALTWDVNYLQSTGKWRIIINDQQDIDKILNDYKKTSSSRNAYNSVYSPNTIILWHGLYKFDNSSDKEKKIDLLNRQLIESTAEYLGIVFHRFLEANESKIKFRLNHEFITPFNPFPDKNGSGIRSLGQRQNKLNNDVLKMEGFVLPVASTSEETERIWRTRNMGLLDLEGIYVYRGDRLIFFGGWNGLIKKEAKLKLARLRIEIGNSNDNIFQLNVSKSRIVIPPNLKVSVLKYISELREQAKSELSKRGSKLNSSVSTMKHTDLFSRAHSAKGTYLEINMDFPLLKNITEELNQSQKRRLYLLLRLISSKFNYNKEIEYNSLLEEENEKGFTDEELIESIVSLKSAGWSKEKILNIVLKDLGYSENNLKKNMIEFLNN
jgi:hypothetical protein